MPALDDLEAPVAKRQRRQEPEAVGHESRNGSRLFSPFRTVGLVSPTSVPFTSVPLGKTTFQVTTSVGTSLQTYDLRKGLNLVFLSRPQTPETITATYAYRDRVFVAWGGAAPGRKRGVWVFKRGRWTGDLEIPPSVGQEIYTLLVFGSWIVGCGERAVEVWKNDTYEHYTTITPVSRSRRTTGGILTSRICTLPTFLNKIVVGTQDGHAEIYNVSTGKLVHTILAPSATSGGVSAITPTSALCLLAIAYADGSLLIYDVETDEQVLQFRHAQQSHPVTSIAFRSDGRGAGEDGRQDGVMATASIESGDVTLWDLSRGERVTGVLRAAHQTSSLTSSTGITKIEFLAQQPVLISTGLDNALRSWVFDEEPFAPMPRLLHSRSGHAAPPTLLRFLPAASDGSDSAGKWMLSAGQDRSLWAFSLRKDAQNSELSQGGIRYQAKKMGHLSGGSSSVEDIKAPPITAMACSLNRDGGMGGVGGAVWKNETKANAEEANTTGWESIVTAHERDQLARTWFWGRKKAGRWTLETGDHQPVSSVAITACGTFALVASAGGSLDMFNLQSGQHRQRFPPRSTVAQAKRLKQQLAGGEHPCQLPRGHSKAITGLAVDTLNRTVISCSLDGSVIFWEFLTGRINRRRHFGVAAPIALRYNTTSGLVAIACDDLCIRVIDIETQKTVRELWGCAGQIYDHCFSHDGRWIVTCSADSVVRVFDLATGHLIDAFKTATCTNVAFSSTGEFLATTHAGNTGINIWNNKSLFTHIPARPVDEDKGVIDLTGTSTFHVSSQLAMVDAEADGEDVVWTNSTSDIEQLDESLLTLSLVPKSRWQTLLNLESIRQRNRPLQPPEKPKAAPFFLGSALTNGTKAINSTSTAKTNGMTLETDHSRISQLASLQPSTSRSHSPFTQHLHAFHTTHDPAPLITYLTSLTPSASDLDIRTLTSSEMPIFVHALTAQLQRRTAFELVNTWMSVFLHIHGDHVSEVEPITTAVEAWRESMLVEERRLGDLVGYTRGVLEFVRSTR